MMLAQHPGFRSPQKDDCLVSATSLMLMSVHAYGKFAYLVLVSFRVNQPRITTNQTQRQNE